MDDIGKTFFEYKMKDGSIWLLSLIIFKWQINASSSTAQRTGGLHRYLVVPAARLICELHPRQVNSFADHQVLGVANRLRGQDARAAEDPGEVDVEDAQDVGAGVHDGQTGVVAGQDPVLAVGRNWGQRSKRRRGKIRRWWWWLEAAEFFNWFAI